MPSFLGAALLMLLWPRAALAQPAPPSPSALTISAYTGLVLGASPEVRSAADALAAADAVYKSQVGALALPTLSFTGTAYPYGYNPANNYQFQTWRLSRDDMSLNTTANWNLFNGFQDYARMRAASLERASAERLLRAAKQDRGFAAIQAFYELDSKNDLLEVARQNLKAQEDQYRQTLDLYKNGMKSLADLLKSETDWRSSELRLASAEGDQKRALVDFNTLIERPGFEPAVLSADLQTGATALPLIDADMARALSQRPEVLRARKELERSAVAVQQAVQNFLPNFRVDATWNRQDTATFGVPSASLGVRNPNYYVGLTLSLPVGFNAVTQAYAIVAAKAQRKAAEAAVAAATRTARQEVHAAYINLERALKSHAIALKKEEIARRSLELVGAQYRQGSADAIRMNQAQTDYLNARVERTLAVHEIFIDRAQYRRAAGDPLW